MTQDELHVILDSLNLAVNTIADDRHAPWEGYEVLDGEPDPKTNRQGYLAVVEQATRHVEANMTGTTSDGPPTIVTRPVRIQDVQPGMVVQYARRDGSTSNDWFTVTRISRQMYGDQLGHVYLFAREADIEDMVRRYGPNLSAYAARHESPLSLVNIQEEVPA